jgi:NhaA family Na+:H+ antiporter
MIDAMKLSHLFKEFFYSEKTSGLILIASTIVSIFLTNVFGDSYSGLWHATIFSKSLEFWINDGLMTFFFLLVGLEIEREIYRGELSNVKRAMLPILGAIGGMLIPAIIHFCFNYGTRSQNGFGIPMATDIAFSLAILSLLGNRVPVSLKIFLTALAIIDDLGAIIVIALFYSKDLSMTYLGLAFLLLCIMLILARLKIYKIWVYLILGIAMWFFMYRSGIHPTITGVLLAFAIPFGHGHETALSYKLQHSLHKPVAFFILPLFALANTAILIPPSVGTELRTANSYGIIFGLFVGKPLGIFLFSIAGAAIGLCSIPADIKRKHLLWTGLLAGIGFTMSIFITLLAFNEETLVYGSKIAIIIGSVLSGTFGYLGLRLTLGGKKAAS